MTKSGFWTWRRIRAFRIRNGWSCSSTPPKTRDRRLSFLIATWLAVPGRISGGRAGRGERITQRIKTPEPCRGTIGHESNHTGRKQARIYRHRLHGPADRAAVAAIRLQGDSL